jgi:hypothetical protein
MHLPSIDKPGVVEDHKYLDAVAFGSPSPRRQRASADRVRANGKRVRLQMPPIEPRHASSDMKSWMAERSERIVERNKLSGKHRQQRIERIEAVLPASMCKDYPLRTFSTGHGPKLEVHQV